MIQLEEFFFDLDHKIDTYRLGGYKIPKILYEIIGELKEEYGIFA
jgi:hypothetical protein